MSKLKRLLSVLCIAVLLVACGGDSAETHGQDDHDHASEAESADHHEDDTHDEEHDDEHGDDEDKSREHGAHEHGAAELNVAWSGNELAVELITPSFNLVGFEYTPATDEEIQAANDAVSVLEQGEFMQFSNDAECAVVSAELHAEFLETDGDEDETHSDVDVEYMVECAHPENLASLDLSGLFAQFSNFEDLRVQWISDNGASAETATASSATISFE